MPSRLFALCNLLGPPSLNRFERLFPSIYNCSLPDFFGHQSSNLVDRLINVFIWILINNYTGVHWIGAEWATESVWTFRKKEKILVSFGIRTPDRSTCSAVTIRLSMHDVMVQNQSGIMGLFLEKFTVTRSVKEVLSKAVFLNRRAEARYRALASIIPGRERPEETKICYKISLVHLITNLNVILYLSTCHTV